MALNCLPIAQEGDSSLGLHLWPPDLHQRPDLPEPPSLPAAQEAAGAAEGEDAPTAAAAAAAAVTPETGHQPQDTEDEGAPAAAAATAPFSSELPAAAAAVAETSDKQPEGTAATGRKETAAATASEPLTRAAAATSEPIAAAAGEQGGSSRPVKRGKWMTLSLKNKVFVQMSEPRRVALVNTMLALPIEFYKHSFPDPGPERGAMTLIVTVPAGAVASGNLAGAGGGGVAPQPPPLPREPQQQQANGQQQEQQQRQGNREQQQEHQGAPGDGGQPDPAGCEEGVLLSRLTDVGGMVEVLRLKTALTCSSRPGDSRSEPIVRPALKGFQHRLDHLMGWRIYMLEAVGASLA